MSFQSFMRGVEAADKEFEDKRRRQREDEERKVRIQEQKHRLDAMKLEEAKAKLGIQAMTPGSFASPDLDQNMAGLLNRVRSKPVAAQPMPIQAEMSGGNVPPLEGGNTSLTSMLPSMRTPQPSAPEQIIPPAGPDIETPFGRLPGTNLEMEQDKGMQAFLQSMKLKELEERQKAAIQSDTEVSTLQRKIPIETAAAIQKEQGLESVREPGRAAARQEAADQKAAERAFTAEQNALNRGQQQTLALARQAFDERMKRWEVEGNVQKPLSAEASKVLSVAQTMLPELDQLRAAVAADYTGALQGIVFGTDRKLSKLVDQIADKVGRLRSGGAINKDEEARFKRQLASFADLMFGKKEDALAAIDGLRTEAEHVTSSIRPGSGTGGTQEWNFVPGTGLVIR